MGYFLLSYCYTLGSSSIITAQVLQEEENILVPLDMLWSLEDVSKCQKVKPQNTCTIHRHNSQKHGLLRARQILSFYFF